MEPTQTPITPQSTEQQSQLPSSSTSSLPPPSSSLPSTSTSQSLPPSSLNSQVRNPLNRPWQQPSHFPHFPSHLSSSSASSSAATPPVPPFSSQAVRSLSPPVQRGGVAIGVPAHHPSRPPGAATSMSSLNPRSFGQQFGGLGRIANMPETMAGSSTSPNFQGHSMLRASSMGSPGLPSPSSSQSSLAHNQPWLGSGPQGRPPLPHQSIRPQLNPQSLQQRSHHPMPSNSQQQLTSTAQQSQPSSSSQPQDLHGPSSRVQQSITQHIGRGQGLGNQRSSSHTMIPPSGAQPGPLNKTVNAENGEPCNRILNKRSIQELVTEIDPSEKLDPEVEDILVDIAEDFVESITSFGCSLAKHRKSNTLDAKDILLHLERNWNITLPGFSGDEIKSYKKPSASEIHRERLAAIRKSSMVGEAANTKSSVGQIGGNAKSHLAKAPLIGSPNNPKIKEAA